MALDRLVIYLLVIWVFIYTASYGVWTWKKKNKFGAIMVFMLAFTAVALPVYALFFKG